MNESAPYRILLHPASELRAEAQPVETIDAATRELARRMLATMYKHKGVGLAANQVGVLARVLVADVSEGADSPLQLANPEIVARSEQTNTHEEGCLSIPEVRAPVVRPAEVVVAALDIASGKKVTIEADELLATCLQHEIDHLDGVLFFDHLSRLRRKRLLAAYSKSQQAPPSDERDS